MTGVKKSPPRRFERILAFKVLYGICFTPIGSVAELQRAFVQSPDTPDNLAPDEEHSFAWELTKGVWEQQEQIDRVISSFSANWRVDRMAKIELTLLRIAIYELIFRSDIPERVAINEAIELTKQFGDVNSRVFVNGILDAAVKAVEAGELPRFSAPA